MAESTAGRNDDLRPLTAPADLAATIADDSDDERFVELRSLLVGHEQRQLEALHAHVHDEAAQTQALSRVLPDALALRSDDPVLTRALAPSVEAAITASVHRDPQPLADALFPVMGPAIRRAVEHMLTAMLESFNRTVEHTLSWRALRWRLIAWRTGTPYAEVVLLNTLKYRVEEIFLIHAETGLLLQHVAADAGAGENADQISAMLTAIRDFVRDSFKVGGTDSLEGFRVGNLSVMVEQGPHAILAATVRGTPPVNVRLMFRQALEHVHRQLSPELKQFQGDAAPFARVRPELESCLVSALQDSVARPRYRKWAVIGGLALLAIGVWTFFLVRDRQRWNRYLDRLSAEPGLVILSSGRRSGRFFVAGLRDPLAANPIALMDGTQLESGGIDSRWEPFQALDPRFVIARATSLLRPPTNVALEFADGVLTARGPAPVQWLVDSERLAPAINGVRRFAYAGREAEVQLKEQVEALSTLFPKGQSTMPPEQFVRVSEAAVLLSQLNDALNLHGRRAQVEILGHTDNDGSDESNGPLSEARATTLLRLLGTRPLSALTFSARGVGSTMPATSGIAESDKELNRRASFRVALSENTAPGGQP